MRACVSKSCLIPDFSQLAYTLQENCETNITPTIFTNFGGGAHYSTFLLDPLTASV